jgi:hypothetical protein
MSSAVGRRRCLLGFNRPDADERMVEESGAIGEEPRRKLREIRDVVLESVAWRAWAGQSLFPAHSGSDSLPPEAADGMGRPISAYLVQYFSFGFFSSFPMFFSVLFFSFRFLLVLLIPKFVQIYFLL